MEIFIADTAIIMTSTSTSKPGSLTITPSHHEADAKQRILIAAFVGVAVILVMILLFAIYCYNKRNPIHGSRHRYSHRSSDNPSTPSRYVYENKGLQYSDQGMVSFFCVLLLLMRVYILCYDVNVVVIMKEYKNCYI